MTVQSLLNYLNEGHTNALVVEQIRILRQEQDERIKKLVVRKDNKLKEMDEQIKTAENNLALMKYNRARLAEAGETLHYDTIKRAIETVLILEE